MRVYSNINENWPRSWKKVWYSEKCCSFIKVFLHNYSGLWSFTMATATSPFEWSTAPLHARPIVIERLLNWNLPRMPNPVPPCWPGPLWYCHIPKRMSAIQGIRWVTEDANDTHTIMLTCTAYSLQTLPSIPFSWWFQMIKVHTYLSDVHIEFTLSMLGIYVPNYSLITCFVCDVYTRPAYKCSLLIFNTVGGI